ncbi:hypothetical protein L1887_56897 [Cichorium endivia]|nr:hypothetical protein L1887_56897 [Cichorium endivia]
MVGQSRTQPAAALTCFFPPWLHYRLLALGAWTIVRIRRGLLLHHHESRAVLQKLPSYQDHVGGGASGARCASSPPRRLQPRTAERGQRGARPSRLGTHLSRLAPHQPQPGQHRNLFQLPSLVGTPDAHDGAGYLDFESTLLGQDAVLPPHILLSQRLASIAKLGKPLGGSFILLGVIALGLGCYRYFAVQATLVRGKFIPSRLGISGIAFLVGALVVAATAVILAGRHTY